MEITKTIQVPWSEDTRKKLISFWITRRFKFIETSDMILTATRGHILWNLVSYNMASLAAKLHIRFPDPDHIELIMTVNTKFQQITDWNRAFWDMEMETCESFLRDGDLRTDEWNQFLKSNRKAAIIWTLTLTLAGRRMPQKNKRMTKTP